MNNVIRVSGIVLIALAASTLLKEKNRTGAVLAAVCAMLTVTAFCVRNGVYEIIDSMTFEADSAFSEVTAVLIKALGIAYISGITHEVCSSAGEPSLAFSVDLAGKTEILLLCIPLISRLLQIAGETL